MNHKPSLFTADERIDIAASVHETVALLRHFEPAEQMAESGSDLKALHIEVKRAILSLYEKGHVYPAKVLVMVMKMVMQTDIDATIFMLMQDQEEIETMMHAKSAPSLHQFVEQVGENRAKGVVRR
jgi:hypothetical protein